MQLQTQHTGLYLLCLGILWSASHKWHAFQIRNDNKYLKKEREREKERFNQRKLAGQKQVIHNVGSDSPAKHILVFGRVTSKE